MNVAAQVVTVMLQQARVVLHANVMVMEIKILEYATLEPDTVSVKTTPTD